MSDDRFDRNELLFGKQGQERLHKTRLLVAGAGGLGSIVITETALLGTNSIAAVDREELSKSNRNRYFGAWHDDPVPGSAKVHLAQRHVALIDPEIEFTPIHDDILSLAFIEALKRADIVIGCVDDDGVRFFLNEACLAYGKTLIDLASDVPEPGKFGGRVSVVSGTHGCLHCRGELDDTDVRRFLASEGMRENEAAAYGVSANALLEVGPSVVSVNGTVASLGITAFMKIVTGQVLPYTTLTYRGDQGTVSRRVNEGHADCS